MAQTRASEFNQHTLDGASIFPSDGVFSSTRMARISAGRQQPPRMAAVSGLSMVWLIAGAFHVFSDVQAGSRRDGRYLLDHDDDWQQH